MRKIILVLVFSVVVLFAYSSYCIEVSVENTNGVVEFSESQSISGSDLRTEWSSYVNKTTFKLSDWDHQGIEGEVKYAMPFSMKDKMDYFISDQKIAESDVSYWGIDTAVNLGWAFPIETSGLLGTRMLTLTPIVGYNFRFNRFTTYTLDILGVSTISDPSDTDFLTHLVNVGIKIDYELTDNLDFFIYPIFGIVAANTYHVEDADDVHSRGGGYIFDLDTGVAWKVNDDFKVKLSFVMELQSLERSEDEPNNWFVLDNTLNLYGGKIAAEDKF